MYNGFQTATVWKRLIALCGALLDFGGDREDFESSEAKALILYLAYIFGKLNAYNKELQGKQNLIFWFYY